jgi:predicted membrane protein (TIGR00267 family)
MIGRIRFLLQLTHGQRIARRYFVTNGFDGALTMMGLTMGFYTAESAVATPVVISACLGAAVALAVSGLASAYVSESAERARELRELEQAVVGDLQDTAHGQAARTVPVLIATVNGLAPLAIALFIMLPLWLEQAGMALPLSGLESSLVLAFVSLFLLGAFLGTVSGRFWLASALRTLLVALLTAGIIYFVNA